MLAHRALRSGAVIAAFLGANITAWFLVSSCSHDWDAYDPRLGEAPDAAVGPDAGADAAADADTGADAPPEADAPPGHVTDGLIALYDFEEGQGDIVGDGVPPALDLTIADPGATLWIPGGLSLVAPTIVRSEGPATKVTDACMATHEITLEIWFRPTVLSQGGPARLITSSADSSHRNFTLGQEEASFYQARLRTTACLDGGFDPDCGTNGNPYVNTPVDAGDVTAAGITQLLYAREATGVRRLYVNGVERASSEFGGDFTNWDQTFPLALGNEITLNRTWLGEMYRAAIYDRALTTEEVAQSFQAGH